MQDADHYTKYWPAAVTVVEALSGVSGTATAEKPVTASTTYRLGNVKPQTTIIANALGTKFGSRPLAGTARAHAIPRATHPAWPWTS